MCRILNINPLVPDGLEIAFIVCRVKMHGDAVW